MLIKEKKESDFRGKTIIANYMQFLCFHRKNNKVFYYFFKK